MLQELIQLGYVETISHETIQITLKNDLMLCLQDFPFMQIP
jgi:hypothetical protein